VDTRESCLRRTRRRHSGDLTTCRSPHLRDVVRRRPRARMADRESRGIGCRHGCHRRTRRIATAAAVCDLRQGGGEPICGLRDAGNRNHRNVPKAAVYCARGSADASIAPASCCWRRRRTLASSRLSGFHAAYDRCRIRRLSVRWFRERLAAGSLESRFDSLRHRHDKYQGGIEWSDSSRRHSICSVGPARHNRAARRCGP